MRWVMVYIIIGGILIFNYSIMKIASKCSRIEEKRELDELLEKNIIDR